MEQKAYRNTILIKPGEKICDCPECKAEIMNGFTDKTIELIKRSRLLKHIDMPSEDELTDKCTEYKLQESGGSYNTFISGKISGFVEGFTYAINEIKRRNNI